MSKVLFIVGAIVAAVVVAFALVVAVELFGEAVYPAPPGAAENYQEMCKHVATIPHWVLAAAVPMWGFAAFASTWVAGRLGNRGCAIFIAVLFLAAVIGNVAMLPYTMWFKVVAPLAVLIAAAGGYAASVRRKVAVSPDGV